MQDSEASNRGFVELQKMGGPVIVPIAFLLMTLIIIAGAILFRQMDKESRKK
ncbi:hypothetical protein BH11ARM2_BH11ARM2_15730 [soil metagenome]